MERKLDRPHLIYGKVANRLVFVEPAKAKENIAFRASKTWGDFRIGAPMIYEHAIEFFGLEDNPPSDEQALDPYDLDADGDIAHFPEQLMLDIIPAAIQERFGRLEETAINGPMLSLDEHHESEIVAALREEGFEVSCEDTLIAELYK